MALWLIWGGEVMVGAEAADGWVTSSKFGSEKCGGGNRDRKAGKSVCSAGNS